MVWQQQKRVSAANLTGTAFTRQYASIALEMTTPTLFMSSVVMYNKKARTWAGY